MCYGEDALWFIPTFIVTITNSSTYSLMLKFLSFFCLY